MSKPRRPNAVDIMAMLTQRKEIATEKISHYERTGEVGHCLYWRTIKLDADMLLSWVAADEYWLIQAEREKQDVERSIRELDELHFPKPALPRISHNQLGMLCGGKDTYADCPACERDMALAVTHSG